jgi:hypothetical protein
VSTSLRDKLERLRKGPRPSTPDAPVADTVAEGSTGAEEKGPANPPVEAPPPPRGTAALEHLESTLLGGTNDGLTLRERLERLVAVTGRHRSAPEPGAAPSRSRARDSRSPFNSEDARWGDDAPEDVDSERRVRGDGGREPPAQERRTDSLRAPRLEELVQGQRCENAHGEFFLAETEVPLESFHGQVPLSRFRTVQSESIPVLSGEPGLAGFDLPGAAFLDTETTGLAGGTGTAAFLIGLGYVDGDRFRVRQYFMRDYHEEAALLHGLAEDLKRFRHMVTFNGKLFDIPLLESRFRLNRARFPLVDAPHLDLLHPARRLWKLRLESCRLQSLEASLLGLRRRGDVPGELIPQLYFDYVRRRDARALCQVFRHNTTDVVSLAALAVLACQWVEGDLAEHPLDVFSLGRVLERAERHDASESAYRRALESGSARVRVPALLKLGARAKRDGRFDEALELWERAAEDADPVALRELCVHHEHRTRDLGRALEWAERALRLLAGGDPSRRRLRADFEVRCARLRRKLAGEPRR